MTEKNKTSVNKLRIFHRILCRVRRTFYNRQMQPMKIHMKRVIIFIYTGGDELRVSADD